MSRFRSRGARALFAAAIVVLLAVAGAAPASAHPLGNFTVNRAIRVDIGSGVSVTAVLDLAEIRRSRSSARSTPMATSC
jgi:hypothetical protein